MGATNYQTVKGQRYLLLVYHDHYLHDWLTTDDQYHLKRYDASAPMYRITVKVVLFISNSCANVYFNRQRKVIDCKAKPTIVTLGDPDLCGEI
jgi:hypothetical protein